MPTENNGRITFGYQIRYLMAVNLLADIHRNMLLPVLGSEFLAGTTTFNY